MAGDRVSTGVVATILGGLLGLMLGHFLTRSWQLQQWKLENRKAEYRELLSKLSAAFTAALHYGCWSDTAGREESVKIENAVTSCIRDRIFIADEIRDCNLLNRWTTALSRFDHNLNRESQARFIRDFEEIRSDLVRIALKDFNKIATLEDEL